MKAIQIVIPLSVLLLVAAVLVHDVRYHFSPDIVHKKRGHRSPQRDWNIWYDQNYVYSDSPLRYQNDLTQVKDIVTPGFAVWSDLATSYYAAAMLPVYVRNVHPHHGLAKLKGVMKFLARGNVCYLEDTSHLETAVKFFNRNAALSKKRGWPVIRYILLNKDKQNFLLRQECMAVRSRHLELNLLNVSHLLYEGEYLNLYELSTFPVESL